ACADATTVMAATAASRYLNTVVLHVLGCSSVQVAQRCSLPSLCRPSRGAPLSTPVMAVRFFVVLLPVRDLLLVAKHLFVAARSAASIRASDQPSLLRPPAAGARKARLRVGGTGLILQWGIADRVCLGARCASAFGPASLAARRQAECPTDFRMGKHRAN